MIQSASRSCLSRLCFLNGAIATSILFSSFLPDLIKPANASLSDSPKAVLDEAWQIVNHEYVDETFNQTDWQAIRHSLLGQEYSSRQHAYTALRRALRTLNDPYTRFLAPEEYNELTDQTSGEVSGIGIRLKREAGTGNIVVVETMADSPAAQAGIQAGDQVLMVDGRSTRTMTVEAVSELIRGEVDSQLTLTIADRNERQHTVILTRARIEVPTVHYSIKERNAARIGYIRLTEFNAHASEQMEMAINDLLTDQAEAFVLDLRGNPGGLLYASIEISRMWLQRGSIVRTVDRQGQSEEITANRTALTHLPLAVLVDGQSASSSEILTGALRDNQRATVVGSPTFGKALVQSLHSLSDGSGIAVTVAHYFTPNGTDISTKGITPDILIDLTDGQRRQLISNPDLLATEADPQFMQAVSALEPVILVNRDIAPVGLSQTISGEASNQVGRNLLLR